MTSTHHHKIRPQIKSLTIPIQISFSSAPMIAKIANSSNEHLYDTKREPSSRQRRRHLQISSNRISIGRLQSM
jgi:hypothetical protein